MNRGGTSLRSRPFSCDNVPAHKDQLPCRFTISSSEFIPKGNCWSFFLHSTFLPTIFNKHLSKKKPEDPTTCRVSSPPNTGASCTELPPPDPQLQDPPLAHHSPIAVAENHRYRLGKRNTQWQKSPWGAPHTKESRLPVSVPAYRGKMGMITSKYGKTAGEYTLYMNHSRLSYKLCCA